MSSNLFQNVWLERIFKQILFLGGVVGQLITWIIAFLRYYEDQPFYVFLSTIISYILFCILSLTIFLRKKRDNELMSDTAVSRKKQNTRECFYSFKLRVLVMIILFIFTGISFVIVYKIVTEPIIKGSTRFHKVEKIFYSAKETSVKIIKADYSSVDKRNGLFNKSTLSDKKLYAGLQEALNRKDEGAIASDSTYFFDMANYPQYESRSLITAFIKGDLSFVGKLAYAIIDGRRIPYARIIDPDRGDRIDEHFGDACALKLIVRAINMADKDSAMIDAIVINVISYEPLPKYKLYKFKPVGREVFYYVEIDDPRECGTKLFKSQYFISQGKKDDFGSYEIEMNHPEQIGIRVNARRPGIYKFKCEILASHKGKKQKITLPDEYEFLFDTK